MEAFQVGRGKPGETRGRAGPVASAIARGWSEADTMAKQNPATDPVSAAMSAIESALNLTDDDETVLAGANASQPQLIPAKPTAATPVLRPSQLASDAPTLLRAGPPPTVPENEPKPAISAATPANDDRENVGAI